MTALRLMPETLRSMGAINVGWPGVTDSEKNIHLMKEFFVKHNGSLKEIHLLPFHNIAGHKYNKLKLVNNMKGIASLKEKDLLPLKEEFESIGIKVNISG